MTTLAAIVLALGVFLHLVATIGIIRLPDFYTRVHAVAVGDTYGIALILLGVGLLEPLGQVQAKLALIVVFYLVATPAATHALSRAARKSGLEPWKKGDP